jgi:hypothetical protein
MDGARNIGERECGVCISTGGGPPGTRLGVGPGGSRVVSFEQTTKRDLAIVNMQTNTAQANGADQSKGSVRVPALRGEESGFA